MEVGRYLRLITSTVALALATSVILGGCGSSGAITTTLPTTAALSTSSAEATTTTGATTTTATAPTSTTASSSSSTTMPAPPPLPEGATLQVILADGTSKPFSLHDLRQLPSSSITVEAKTEEGPALIEVLKAAGATDFASVTVVGEDQSVTLAGADITVEEILDFTNKNSMKFASTHVPKDKWPHEVRLITVR